MAGQLVYNQEMGVAFAGMWADASWKMVESRANGEASAAIAFGWAVKKGTGLTVIKVAANTDVISHVIAHSHTYAPGIQMDTVGVLPKRQLNCVRYGRLWVLTARAVNEGDRAYYNSTTNLWDNTTGGALIDCTSSCIFRTATGTAGLAVLEFDFRNKP